MENYLKNLEASAAENNENYYILLEFSDPPDILLEDKERNSTITIYHYDKIIFEVDRAGKRLLLNTHDKDNETLIFLPTIGRHKQNAVKHFLQEYNTRNQGSQGQLFWDIFPENSTFHVGRFHKKSSFQKLLPDV